MHNTKCGSPILPYQKHERRPERYFNKLGWKRPSETMNVHPVGFSYPSKISNTLIEETQSFMFEDCANVGRERKDHLQIYRMFHLKISPNCNIIWSFDDTNLTLQTGRLLDVLGRICRTALEQVCIAFLKPHKHFLWRKILLPVGLFLSYSVLLA